MLFFHQTTLTVTGRGKHWFLAAPPFLSATTLPTLLTGWSGSLMIGNSAMWRRWSCRTQPVTRWGSSTGSLSLISQDTSNLANACVTCSSYALAIVFWANLPLLALSRIAGDFYCVSWPLNGSNTQDHLYPRQYLCKLLQWPEGGTSKTWSRSHSFASKVRITNKNWSLKPSFAGRMSLPGGTPPTSCSRGSFTSSLLCWRCRLARITRITTNLWRRSRHETGPW